MRCGEECHRHLIYMSLTVSMSHAQSVNHCESMCVDGMYLGVSSSPSANPARGICRFVVHLRFASAREFTHNISNLRRVVVYPRVRPELKVGSRVDHSRTQFA